MATPSNIILGQHFFPNILVKQGVDPVKELKGTGWCKFMKRRNKWRPNLIKKFLVGCKVIVVTHKVNDKDWIEIRFTRKYSREVGSSDEAW